MTGVRMALAAVGAVLVMGTVPARADLYDDFVTTPM